eukprot:Opistho-2@49190
MSDRRAGVRAGVPPCDLTGVCEYRRGDDSDPRRRSLSAMLIVRGSVAGADARPRDDGVCWDVASGSLRDGVEVADTPDDGSGASELGSLALCRERGLRRDALDGDDMLLLSRAQSVHFLNKERRVKIYKFYRGCGRSYQCFPMYSALI